MITHKDFFLLKMVILKRIIYFSKLFLLFLIALVIFLFSLRVVFAQNLLQNLGFEEGDFGWNKYGSTQLRIVDSTLNGTKAGALTSDKTGAKYIYQDFETFGGEKFQLSGWIFWNDSSIANAKLRVEWYDSSSTRVGLDEISLVSKSNEWQYLTMSIKAPPSSKTARVEAYAYFNQTNPSNPVLFDDLVFEKVNQSTSGSTPTPTSSPTPTPTLAPTPTSSPTPTPPTPTSKPLTPTPKPTATYKINEVKDEDGEILNNVKIYVDDIYLHHYAPEVLIFCDGCQCDSYVDCGFGQHTIKLKKTGYNDWNEMKIINAGDFYEVYPVMSFSQSNPSPTPTPTIKLTTPTPTLKIVPAPTKKPAVKTASDSGEVLGEEESSPAAFYPWEATEEEKINQESTPSAKNKLLPKIFLGAGFSFLFGVAFWLWYNFYYTNPNGTV